MVNPLEEIISPMLLRHPCEIPHFTLHSIIDRENKLKFTRFKNNYRWNIIRKRARNHSKHFPHMHIDNHEIFSNQIDQFPPNFSYSCNIHPHQINSSKTSSVPKRVKPTAGKSEPISIARLHPINKKLGSYETLFPRAHNRFLQSTVASATRHGV